MLKDFIVVLCVKLRCSYVFKCLYIFFIFFSTVSYFFCLTLNSDISSAISSKSYVNFDKMFKLVEQNWCLVLNKIIKLVK